jgi:hypothetical protein
MHTIEPYYRWRHLYIASEDERSPFYGREYSEFEFTHAIYNYVIHPQWDAFGSYTLYGKILYADYIEGYCIIELIGEWNDLLYNDIMFLKRNLIEVLSQNGINKFIIIGEHVLNFHFSDSDYYQEWNEEVEDGWIIFINFRRHVIDEFIRGRLGWYLLFGGEFETVQWRNLEPDQFYHQVSAMMQNRLNP